MIARVQPSLELRGGDASLPEVTEEAPPSDVLEHEVGDEHSRDADDNRRPEAGDTGCDETDHFRADVAERDPGSRPQEGAGGAVEQESPRANGDR